MTEIIPEPKDNNPETGDWQGFLFRTTFQGGGFLQVRLTNMELTDVSSIAQGSRIEVNGSFYRVASDELINDTYNMADNQWVFVYANVLPAGLLFEYRNQMPVYDVVKCGWYLGTDRCIAKMYKYDVRTYYGKRILTDQDSMYKDFFPILPPISAVTTNRLSAGSNTGSFLTIPPGIYRFVLRGGTAGRGGRGGYRDENAPAPNSPESRDEVFVVYEDTEIELRIGYGGSDGGNGEYKPDEHNVRFGAGGGSGATSGSSSIKIGSKLIVARGAQGTAGMPGNSGGSNPDGPGGTAPAFAPAKSFSTTNPIQLQVQGAVAGNAGRGHSWTTGGAVNPYGPNSPTYLNSIFPGSGGIITTARNGTASLYKFCELIKRNNEGNKY
jgi:hypothetical protein